MRTRKQPSLVPIGTSAAKKKARAGVALAVSLALQLQGVSEQLAALPAPIRSATPVAASTLPDSALAELRRDKAPLFAALTLVGVSTASGTSVTPVAHQAGDIIVIFAMHGGATTIPSLPNPYITPSGVVAGTKSLSTAPALGCRVGYKIATGTSDTSGTWTNASELICHVYRPSAGFVARLGQLNSSTSATATVTYPVLTTLADTSGASWIIGFTAASNTTQAITTAPTGMTNQSSVVGASYQAAGFDTNGGVSSWSAQTANVTSTGSSVTFTFEIVLASTTNSLSSYVYQHIKGGGNPWPRQQTGTVFKIPVDQACGTGNFLIFKCSYDNGIGAPTVSGSVNGAFTLVATVSGGAGNLDTSVYIKPNATSGQETITVTCPTSATTAGSFVTGLGYVIDTVGTTNFVAIGAASNAVGQPFIASGAGSGTGTATQGYIAFEYELTELYNVATSFTATLGTTYQDRAYSTTVNTGAFTPPNNNATGGNLIWASFTKAEASNAFPTKFGTNIFPGTSGFQLLSADNGWGVADNQNTFPKAVCACIQATSASITPALTSIGDGDNWNSIALAIAVSTGSGTAPSSQVRFNTVQHFATDNFGGTTAGGTATYAVQCPAYGNCRVIASDDPSLHSLTVRDNEGNTWTSAGTGSGIWYFIGAAANPNLWVFIDGGGTDAQVSWRYYDLSNVGAFDSFTAQANSPTGTTFTLSPSPTPVASTTMTIINVGLGNGPCTGISSAPAGAVYGLATYTGEIDKDEIENADCSAHVRATAAGAQPWTFFMANTPNTMSGGSVTFTEASTGASGSAAITEGADVASGSGALSTSGSAAISEAADVASGSGTAGVAGSGAATEGADVASGSGALSTSGSGSPTEGADTVAGTGALSTSGSGAATEGADTVSGAGVTGATGSGAASEGADVASGAGALSTSGTGAPTEAADVAAGSGIAGTTATGAAAEGADAVAGSGSLSTAGSAAIAEGADAAAGSGALATSGSAAIQEGADTSSGTGIAGVAGSAAAVEGADTASGAGTLSTAGSAAIAEGADIASGSGTASGADSGSAAITEGADAASGTGTLSTTGTAADTEAVDTAAGSGLAGALIVVGTPFSVASRPGAFGASRPSSFTVSR